MGAVADTLMAAMSRGLGLDDDHYPATPPGEAGVNSHPDIAA